MTVSDRQVRQLAEVVAALSQARVRNMAAFRAGHYVSVSGLRSLEAAGMIVRLTDGRWCAVLPLLDVFDVLYPRP